MSGYSNTWPFWATITAVSPGTTTISSESWEQTDPYGGYSMLSAVSPAQITSGCGDARGNIIKEYKTYSVPLSPACPDFTQSRRSFYFMFSEINTGDYAWALVRYPLIADPVLGYGLDDWRVWYGASRIINSAYRNPVRNANVGGASNSRHMFGDAVDLRNETRTENEWTAMQTAAANANADYIEPRFGPCDIGCVHADWRSHSGGYQ